MTLEQITYGIGVLVSLGVAYIPKFNDWFTALGKQNKALFMLALAFGYVAGVFGLSCAGYPLFQIVCDAPSAWALAQLFIQFAIASQATFLVAVRPFQK